MITNNKYDVNCGVKVAKKRADAIGMPSSGSGLN